MSRRRTLTPEAPPLSPLPAQPAPVPAAWRWVLAAVLLAYVCLSATHLVVTPVAPDTSVNYINAPDEAAHLLYVRAIAYGGRIPTRGDLVYPTYEWHQPPLYYALAAPLYRFGPHAVRGLSLLLGLVALLLIFYGTRRLFPEDPPLAVLSTGLAALLPMRQALCATVDNDVLLELLFTLALVLCIQCLRSGFPLRRAGFLGIVLGAALLTKATGLLLAPVLLAALMLFRRSGEQSGNILAGATLLFVLAAALAGGWYARNVRLYGEATVARAFAHEFAGTKKANEFLNGQGFTAVWWTGQPEPAAALSRWDYTGLLANWTYRTFFASYTPPGRPASLGIPYFLPPPFYMLFAMVGALAVAGLVRAHFRRRREFTATQLHGIALLFMVGMLVAGAFVAFTWVYFQAQGRYLYPAMFPLSALTALGFRSIMPARYRDIASLGALAVMFVLSAAFLGAAVLPTYS